MSSASGRRAASHRDNLPSIRWRSWPLADDLLHTMIVVVGLVVAWVVVRWVTGQTAMAVIALVALAISLWRFFLPVSYELSVEGRGPVVFRAQTPNSLESDPAVRDSPCRRAPVTPFGTLPHGRLSGTLLALGNHREEILAQLHSCLGETDEGRGARDEG